MRRWSIWLAVAAAAIAALTLGGTAGAGGKAKADVPQIVIGPDGETAPVFSYANAIRERVFIPVPGVDQNGDGQTDQVAADIIRPAETNQGLKVPAIIDPSPYYTSLGRGNETEYLQSASQTQPTAGPGSGLPLFYDNFFVPRGFAVIAAQAVGTAFSTGCPLHGGPGDVAGFKAVIDWLRGRTPAYTSLADTTPVTADWNNGKNAMIGKSYDGTFANGVASTGVEGLTTIVPISAISDWYDYSRMGGIRFNSHYPASLSNSITANVAASQLGGTAPPSNNASCLATRNAMSAVGDNGDGDTDGDINSFWQARNYNLNVGNVHAAVFASHGLNDDNVRPNHFSQWWAGLAANNVPRKVWLHQEGHVDPFDYRRSVWVDTLHRWFDYWLQGVPNGIMNDPQADIETGPNTWETAASWPLPGTQPVNVFLQGTAAGAKGVLGLSTGGATDSLTFTDANLSETNYLSLTNTQANKLTFLSPPLTHNLRISGTPIIDIQASLSKTQTNLSALLVDYGGGVLRVNRTSNEGVANQTTSSCWADSTQCAASCPTTAVLNDPCYRDVAEVTTTPTQWRVSKGILDSTNRDSLFSGLGSAATIGQKYEFRFPTLPNDFTFVAGHQIGIVIGSNFSGYSSANGTTATAVTLDTRLSTVTLPIVGGYSTALASGGFTVDTTGPTLTLPGTITQEATAAAGNAVTYSASASDNEDPNPTVNCSPASGSTFPVGDTAVSCTGRDASGNTTPGTFHVVITDTTKPVVDTHADILGVEATSPAGAKVSYTPPLSTDIVDGVKPSTCQPPPDSVFPLGPSTTTCSVTDTHGNTGSSTFTVTVVDTTAPTTTLALAPATPDGLNGWYVTNPLITLTATDTVSPIAKTRYYIGPTPNWVDYNGPLSFCSAANPCGKHWFHWASSDTAGNTEATNSVTLSVDLNDPTASATISPAAQNGWYASPVVTLTGDDGPTGSGIDHISYKVDGEASWHVYTAPLSGFSTGNHFVQFQPTDVAGRNGAVSLVAFKADAAKPSVTITKPADGAVYPLDKPVAAAYKCTDGESGLATCAGTVANGANVDTSTIGSHTFTVTATDKAGNTTTKTAQYTVVYTFNGLFAPITNSEDLGLNLVHAGDLIKVGFGLNGDRGLNIGTFGSAPVACPSWAPHTVPAGGQGTTAGLSYGASSGHYTYGWQTDSSWAGTCRQLSLQLADGTPAHTAVFMFFA